MFFLKLECKERQSLDSIIEPTHLRSGAPRRARKTTLPGSNRAQTSPPKLLLPSWKWLCCGHECISLLPPSHDSGSKTELLHRSPLSKDGRENILVSALSLVAKRLQKGKRHESTSRKHSNMQCYLIWERDFKEVQSVFVPSCDNFCQSFSFVGHTGVDRCSSSSVGRHYP